MVQAAVASYPVEPGPGVDRPLVGDHRRVRRDEHLLKHVLGVLHRADEMTAERQQARLVAVEQDLESAVVPVTDQSDETLVALQPQKRGPPREQATVRCGCEGGGLHAPLSGSTRYCPRSCSSTAIRGFRQPRCPTAERLPCRIVQRPASAVPGAGFEPTSPFG